MALTSETVPDWGIEPVPPELRRFGLFDTTALWGNLGISLLLPVVAAFLVPGLSFAHAMFAIVIGVVIGNVMLGYAGRIGAATGAPAMVLYRPSLGRRGSYAPTALNVLQNIGWGSFELIIIGTASAAVSKRIFGFGARPVWTLAFGAIVTFMAMSGPLLVVTRWIKRYAVWLVLASSIYLTVYVLFVRHPAFGGHGQGMPFWQGVDLVVAMPISWIPLAADYTRFSRSKSSGSIGSALGYGIAQAWFYFLGVILILSNVAKSPDDPALFITAVLAVPAGLLALAILAVDETDEAFANIYSASVSVQNAFPRVSQRRLSIAIGAVCTVLAVLVPLVQYQNFLLLIGAVFVPLFGVLAAHYAVVRRGYQPDDIYSDVPSLKVWGVVAWLAGFATYNWLNPGTVTWWVSAMKAIFGAPPSFMSASIASFLVAFALQGAERFFRRSATLR